MKHIYSNEDCGLLSVFVEADFWRKFTVGDQETWIKELSKVLEKRINDNAEAYFPREYGFCGDDGYGNKTPRDPLTIYVCLNWADDMGGEGPVFSFSLRDLWKRMLDGSVNLDSKKNIIEDKKSAKDVRAISSALRKLADEMDAAIKTLES
jgi:hypothetical protein